MYSASKCERNEAPRLERLSPEDARILRLETSAIAGHTCKIVVVAPRADGPIGLEQLRAHVTSRLDRAPRSRQRVVFPIGDPPERLARGIEDSVEELLGLI